MIKNLEINGYKGLIDFKLDNLSQVNIISGSNNVGKTALLEAISLSKFNRIAIFRQQLIPIFEARDLTIFDINLFLENINLTLKINNKKKTIKHKTIEELTSKQLKSIEEKYGEYEDFLIMNFNKKYTIMPFQKNPKYLKEYKKTFIDSSKPTNMYLTNEYSSIQDLGKQDEFLKYLQIIDKNITRIEPQIRGEKQSFLRVTLENPKQSLISSELGEGTNRYIEILSVLLKNSNGIVLIDEIENGIHYTKLYDIWKAIIEIVQKEKIQLFVTTHNLESIEALTEASEAMKFDKIASVKLQKDEKNVIYPVVRNYSSFVATVDSGMDIR